MLIKPVKYVEVLHFQSDLKVRLNAYKTNEAHYILVLPRSRERACSVSSQGVILPERGMDTCLA